MFAFGNFMLKTMLKNYRGVYTETDKDCAQDFIKSAGVKKYDKAKCDKELLKM